MKFFFISIALFLSLLFMSVESNEPAIKVNEPQLNIVDNGDEYVGRPIHIVIFINGLWADRDNLMVDDMLREQLTGK